VSVPAYQYLKHSYLLHCHSKATLVSGFTFCYKQSPDTNRNHSLVRLLWSWKIPKALKLFYFSKTYTIQKQSFPQFTQHPECHNKLMQTA